MVAAAGARCACRSGLDTTSGRGTMDVLDRARSLAGQLGVSMADDMDRGAARVDPPAPDRTRVLRVALAALPFVGILGGAGLANRAEPFVLGLPFLMAWIVGWVVASSAIMAIVYALDPVNRGPQPGDEGPRP